MTTDAMALAHFETLCQTQQPAATPWAPVTPYDFESRQAIEGPHPQLILDVFQPQAVADIGCGPGHLVTMLEALDVAVTGFDKAVIPPAVRWLDVADRHRRPAMQYDLVICREVLEHLTILEIRRAVETLCDLSSRFVYVTTRFCPDPCHLLSVATSDDLDPTHITLLHQDFLRVLFVLEGFMRRADLEARMDWRSLRRVLVYERP